MQPSTESSSSKAGMIAGMFVLGLIIGGVAFYYVGHHYGAKSDTAMTSDHMTSTAPTSATDGTTVGGAKMVETKDIVDNAVNAKNVTTTVSLVKLAGLVDTLKSPGPFTVFAPNNDAFAKLPAATVTALQQPANVDQLKNILTYHVVSGTYTAADLRVMASKGQTLTSVQGEVLTPVMVDNAVQIKDAKGNMVAIETPDIISSNGVTHVITSVLMP